MKKSFIRVTALILVLMTFCSVPAAAAAASVPAPDRPQSDAYISSFYAGIVSVSKGTVTVQFNTTGTGTMENIGATVIYVYKWNSTFPVATLTSVTTSSMMGHNTVSYGRSYTISSNIISGEKYYAVVYCYAGKNGGGSTQTYTTSYTTAK